MKWRTKQLIYAFLHPFKKGFWCFINIQKFKIGMLWETWNKVTQKLILTAIVNRTYDEVTE